MSVIANGSMYAWTQMVENMELAFIAWNRYPGSATGGQSLPNEPGWAEWLVRRPSVVGTVRPSN